MNPTPSPSRLIWGAPAAEEPGLAGPRHLVHASDADQFVALVSRWGPDGMDPRWGNPIKDRVRQVNQANAPHHAMASPRNGLSTTTTSATLTKAARENFLTSSSSPDGFPGRQGNSATRWDGGLQIHAEDEEQLLDDGSEEPVNELPLPPPRKPITPSLATLEKAVSARIYFENFYFPLFRHPPSREQRRLAMERDMALSVLPEP
ncbi:hypothetical protein B0H14DRAFT_3708953 [Mycena olivaceomarginata]|nr:hypothetical protein B0H14DRAFT_3708953 [Mycena olivaceomarginata]